MKTFFIVGEDSGDALAAPLIAELKEKHGDNFQCSGVGGPAMEEQGFNTLLPLDQISVIGLWEVIPKIPRLLKISKAIIEEIEQQQPDAVITVDFPDFNFGIAKKLKKRGIFKGKIIHYVSPSVWAWRSGRAKKISGFLDGIMCLFPMEVAHYTEHGLKAKHVGHPLVESTAITADPSLFRKENSIPDSAKTVGLFFGSRENEFKSLSEILKNSAKIMSVGEEEKIHVIAPTLPKHEFPIQKIMTGFDLPMYISANPNVKWEAFKSCDVAIATSGTVALELAYAGIPHIIAYKVSFITGLLLKILVKTKKAHLANILLEDDIVPEFLQRKCIPENIAEAAHDLLHNTEKRDEQLKNFAKLHDILKGDGDGTPNENAASFITDIVHSK